jgi:hypothetical protein
MAYNTSVVWPCGESIERTPAQCRSITLTCIHSPVRHHEITAQRANVGRSFAVCSEVAARDVAKCDFLAGKSGSMRSSAVLFPFIREFNRYRSNCQPISCRFKSDFVTNSPQHTARTAPSSLVPTTTQLYMHRSTRINLGQARGLECQHPICSYHELTGRY